MLEQDRSLFRALAEIYLEDFEGLVLELANSCTSGECQAIQAAAHKFRGLVANFHAAAVVDQLLQVERFAEQNAPPSVDQVKSIVLQARCLADELNHFLSSRASTPND